MKGKGRIRRGETMGGRNWGKNRCATEVETFQAALTEEVRRHTSVPMLRDHGRISYPNTGDNILNNSLNITPNITLSVSQGRTPVLTVLKSVRGVSTSKLVVVLKGLGDKLSLSVGAIVTNMKLSGF